MTTSNSKSSETTRGRLIGVGVGPGDPGLLTRNAESAIRRADRVVAPTTSTSQPGRAETVVRGALDHVEFTRVSFDMTPNDVDGGESARERSHLAAAARVRPFLDAGETVAFITIGDPNIYSTFPSLVSALRTLGSTPHVSTVPGITAFQDLASRSGTVLLDGSDSLSLVTALSGAEELEHALGYGERAVVVYKGGRYIREISAVVKRFDRLDGAVVGELMGLSGERICSLRDYDADEASYLVTVIVPARLPR